MGRFGVCDGIQKASSGDTSDSQSAPLETPWGTEFECKCVPSLVDAIVRQGVYVKVGAMTLQDQSDLTNLERSVLLF